MAEWGYEDQWGATYDPGYYYDDSGLGADYSSGYEMPIGPGMGWDYSSSPAYQQFIGGGDPYGPGSSGDPMFPADGSGGGGWLNTILGGLGSVGSFLGSNASWLGPLASAAGGLGAGALGSNASADAARLQAAALNRGLDLQTAQWLQQQANQAPWLQAGQQALPQLQQLASQGAPAPFQPPAPLAWGDYGLPGATPTWAVQPYTGPQAVQAGDYRWHPQAGPQAANYRYTPGAVPTLSGQALLANDPGVQLRLDEGRRALEASAAARGGLTSGATLAALQRQGQELASQEYGNAWNRASQQAQLREQWHQYATAQGWTQAQAEAAFREQQAQLASQQGFNQALAGQGQQFTQGLQAQQWNQQQAQQFDRDLYNRWWQRDQEIYNRALQGNQSEYERAVQAYNSQNAQQTTNWNRYAALAGLGQTAVGQLGTAGQNIANQQASLLGQLGSAQGIGALGSAANWNRAIGGATNNISDLLAGLSR